MADKPKPTIADVESLATAVVTDIRASLRAESLTANFALQSALENLGGFSRNATLAALCAATQIQNARDKSARETPNKKASK